MLLRQESQEISLLPWIDLDKLTVVSEDIDQESEKLRQNLLLSNTTEVAGVSKKSVIDWLEKHQLRVSQEAEDVILVEGGLAKLRPPYRPSEIECSNVIILDRVTSILTGMSTGF